MPVEQGAAVSKNLNTAGGSSDDEKVVVGSGKKEGFDNFQQARDAVAQKGKAKVQELEQQQEFDTKVSGAVDHLIESTDWERIEKEVTGEELLRKKIEGWRGGISPANKQKLEALRKTMATNAGQQPATGTATPPAGGGQVQVQDKPQPVAPAVGLPAKVDDKVQPTAAKPVAEPTQPAQPKFNPFTGEPLKADEAIKFDPITGKPLTEEQKQTATLDADKIVAQIRESLKSEIEGPLQQQLEELKAQHEQAEKERQALIDERDKQKELRRKEEEKRTFLEFQYAAKQSNIPDDMVAFAFARANEIANDPKLNPNYNAKDPAARQMSYDQIYEVMRKTNPSFFHERQQQIVPAADGEEEGKEEGKSVGSIQPKAKAGTGTSTGGGMPSGSPGGGSGGKKGADSFEEATSQLKKAWKSKYGG